MSLMERMLQADGRLRACWLGNDGWLFSHGGHLIATDLDFCLSERALASFEELSELAARLEFLLITHAHTDHFNPETVRTLMEGGACRLILPWSCWACAQTYDLDPRRIHLVRPGRAPLDLQNNPLPMARGGEVFGLPGWLGVEAIRALHGHRAGSVYGGANEEDCGYILRLGGKTIVQPGDSVLLQEHLDLRDIDVLLVSPTEHNMGVGQAQHWIETVRPRWAIAQHFGTYHETGDNAFWTHGYQRELLAALGEEMGRRYLIPAYAQPIVIE